MKLAARDQGDIKQGAIQHIHCRKDYLRLKAGMNSQNESQ
jgi:hypothetical protein